VFPNPRLPSARFPSIFLSRIFISFIFLSPIFLSNLPPLPVPLNSPAGPCRLAREAYIIPNPAIEHMSEFREQLRGRIARVEGESRDAARAADQRSDARRLRIEQADATAETVLRDVLRPLVEDFRAVLVGEGLLREARLLSETADVKEQGKRGKAKTMPPAGPRSPTSAASWPAARSGDCRSSRPSGNPGSSSASSSRSTSGKGWPPSSPRGRCPPGGAWPAAPWRGPIAACSTRSV
jgi:hypothetical protein